MKSNPQRHAIALVTLVVGISVVALVVLERGSTAAAPDHSVYLPIVFKADTVILPPGQLSTQQFRQGDIFTTACLEVNQKVYPQGRWWEDADDNSKSPEHAFKAVIWTLRHNDRAALIKALDPKAAEVDPHFKLNGRPVGAAELAELELQGFETLELVAVPRAYEFDDLVVFLARVRPQQPQQPFSVLPFAFAREADGSFGFLPRGGEKVTYQIVQDWFYFYKSWGGPGNNEPKYCAPDTVKRATHKISLFCTMSLGNTTSPACNADDEKVWNRSQLFLSRVSFASPGQHAALVAQIKLTIEKMKSAMAADNIDEFAKYMDAGGAKKVKQGFASADETARSRYKAAIAKIEPFFLFDASPLVVVYTTPLDGDIRSQYTGNGVMYFTLTANNEWVWTNASTVTGVDKVFTVGPLYKAALLSKPFSNFEIR